MKPFGVENILLITGKFPGVTSDIDGGSIMVSHLIEALREKCSLDVLFTRTYNPEFKIIEGVSKVIFHTNKIRNSNKFIRRLENIEWNCNEFSQLIPQYDKVVIIHCSKAFGLENLPEELLDKVILFPMYLTSSYKRSNEIVPDEYSQAEKKIVPKIKTIVSPSQSEKSDIINDYGVPEKRIIVIPRAVNSHIESKVRQKSTRNKLVYIGAIKKQKRNDDAIVLLSKLKKMGGKFHLYLVGSKQDDELYAHCMNLISRFELADDITFCGVLSQKEIAELLNEIDINISVSRWETFGRGVFEGLRAGLPTIVFNRLACLSEYANANNGISYVEDINEMANKIFDLCANHSSYKNQSQKAIENSLIFSIEEQKKKLLKVILCPQN
jgi:glycosyltransferase involved in cell wall biosynthesis